MQPEKTFQSPLLAKVADQAQTQAWHSFANQLHTLAQEAGFLYIANCEFLYDSAGKLLWYVNRQAVAKSHSASDYHVKQPDMLPEGWRLPSIGELRAFAKKSGNPLRAGTAYRLYEQYAYLANENNGTTGIDLDSGCESSRPSLGCALLCNAQAVQNFSNFIRLVMDKGWNIEPLGRSKSPLPKPADFSALAVGEALKNLDNRRANLPKLTADRLTDVSKGLWEAFGEDESLLHEYGIRARDPAQDIQKGNIGIDFGTSSTVVAYEDRNGSPRLLRIGVQDFLSAPEAKHYENPTVLEFIDFPAFQAAWREMAQQPLVAWGDVRCSHEALARLRNDTSDTKVIGSILAKIKQWALRGQNDAPLYLTDQKQQHEHRLAPLALRSPVKGQPLAVGKDDPFDPIELYAWFLGLNINWRERGIFLKYYLTFPVKYPRDVKEKVLASFKRGLIRSLPESLARNSEIMEQFVVEERASEPAAYAAAMKASGIEPTDEGIAYAVFDFGGGTTDFDYGYYRWANDEEDAKGIEEVFEHYEAAGDNFLGGENLLENLAYRVFQQNLQTCREQKIPFTKPLDAKDFPGSELLLAKSQIAQTNTQVLMAQLRPFWEGQSAEESGTDYQSGRLSVGLFDNEGNSGLRDFAVDTDQLQSYLTERISQGIEEFFISMRKAFAENIPAEVHILLAGNSSRSKYIQDAFGLENAPESLGLREKVQTALRRIFGSNVPRLTIHAPLTASGGDESTPTAKTGVALGILRLAPGSSVKVINRASLASDGEAPFAHYVGRIRRGKFEAGLQRGAAYGQWTQIGVVGEDGVFNLFHSQAARAHTDEMREGDSELYKERVDFVGTAADDKVFARVLAPHEIELCTAADETQTAQENNLKKIELPK